MDYKSSYLKEKIRSLQLEMNLMNIRANEITAEIPKITEELTEHDSKGKTSDTE